MKEAWLSVGINLREYRVSQIREKASGDKNKEKNM
jgi:hypothetical protein